MDLVLLKTFPFLQIKCCFVESNEVTSDQKTFWMRQRGGIKISSHGEIDDADIAAGSRDVKESRRLKEDLIHNNPMNKELLKYGPVEIDFGCEKQDDPTLQRKPVFLLGFDISNYNTTIQFLICASCVFLFTLVYGYLQELLSVHIFNRKLALFLAAFQFSGYSAWSLLMKNILHSGRRGRRRRSTCEVKSRKVPFSMYVGISILRSFDLAMSNMAMVYINYPAKTLIKSSRVVWTMIFGVFISNKRYKPRECFSVLFMVCGLIIFIHADATGGAIFKPLGVLMLIGSLMSDGAISNFTESIMKSYDVCQDEFILYLFSLSTVAIISVAGVRGDLVKGIRFLQIPGTLDEIENGEFPTISCGRKISIMVIFSTFGYFGSSSAATITKHFGAFETAITSTVRKAATLFFSFLIFPNVCTLEHLLGMAIFIVSLFSQISMTKNRYGRKKTEPNNKRDASNVLLTV